ncbi:MAG: BlaI/MecI/CopY family transcriptional regulator [Phycisphaerales bacterium]|nr:MAG: BlaI/MecI/CopY family transcriptional regulator [Phycisphaerales bacterium]
MKKLPRISESEWLVMRVLWSKGEATANEVVEELAGRTKWNPRTVKTLITRLSGKGAVKYKKEGRMYRYYPAVGQADCVRMERKSFVRRVYGGTTKPMLAAFIEDADLSPQDISELKKILERKGKE